MNTEHIYTCQGRQRAVFVSAYGETVAYDLTGAPAGSVVEMTDSPLDEVRAGKGVWVTLLDLSGMVTDATAIRVVNGACNGCLSKLYVSSTENRPDETVIGQLTRINAELAHVNKGLRECVQLAA